MVVSYRLFTSPTPTLRWDRFKGVSESRGSFKARALLHVQGRGEAAESSGSLSGTI